MVQSIYLNSRISRYAGLLKVLLVLILFSAMAQFASFGLIQAHVVSFYGAQAEDISFALQIAYAGIITTLPVQFRLVKYFNTRSYLLTAFLVGILINIGCLFVHDLFLFAILRFFTGVVTCVIAGCLLLVLFSTLPESKRMLVGVSLFFTLILTCGLIIGLGASWMVLRTNYTEFYYVLIGLQAMAMLFCIIVFKPRPHMRPFPLYQIDWAGCVLFMFGAIATLFVMVYGPKRYWLADTEIKCAAGFAFVAIALFLYRQTTLKRPLIDLTVFRSGKFIFAILLMLLFWGVKDSINLIYGYSASVLGWNSADVANAGMFNIAGVIMATFITVKVIQAKKQNLPKLLLIGFSLLFFYHLWVYANLTPDLSFAQLSIPIYLHGFACGLLFVPVSIFCMASVPQSTGMTGIVILTYARFIATLNSIAGFYTLQLSYNQQYKINFLEKLIPESAVFSQRQELYKGILTSKGYSSGEATGITNMLIAKAMGIQSQLLTIRAVFFIVMVLVMVALIILLIFAVINKVKEGR